MNDQFANPYLACEECGARVTHRPGNHNQPCGHRASFESVCPSWGPVDGCRCVRLLGHNPHAQWTGITGPDMVFS